MCQQLIALAGLAIAIAVAATNRFRLVPSEDGFVAVDGLFCFGKVSFADRETIECIDTRARWIGLGLPREVGFKIFPIVARLIIRAEGATLFVAAMHHAILAARIAGDAVHHAV